MSAHSQSPSLETADAKHAQNPASLPSERRHKSDAAWADCRESLAREIAPAFFERFIAVLSCAGVDANQELCLIAPDAKLQRHVEQRYLPVIREAVRAHAGQSGIRGARILGPEGLAASLHAAFPPGPQFGAPAAVAPGELPPMRGQASVVDLADALGDLAAGPEPRPTVGSEPAVGQFALCGHVAAAVNRAELDRLWQGAAFASGCLSFIGPSGSGKTAIAKAYAAHISRQGETVRYLTAEEFLTEFSLACRKRENIAWRETLRAHRVLIIDDFQFIKPQAARSQEELQYLIDAFQSSGRLLILCSDRDAVAQGLSAALASRLQAGDRILLAYPEQSERETIVEQVLSAEAATRPGSSLELREEHIRYLAARIQRDMRHLKSAVRRLIQAQSLRVNGQHDWNTNAVDQLCGDLYTRRPTVAPEAVRQAVAEFCQVDEAEITGPRRDRRFTRARHLTAYLCVEYLQLSQKETAAVIGRREHGSVVHARKKIEELLAEDLFLRRQVQSLAESIFSS